MKKLLLGAISLVLMTATACGADRAEEFRQGIPRAETVALVLPARTSQPLSGEGTRRDGLEGQTSDFYRLTREVTVFVNGGTAAVLNLVARITTYPATTVANDSAVWGPHTDPLSPNTWKLTVSRTAPNTYSYRLEGKAKTEADSAYRAVLSGSHLAQGENLGAGRFTIDWNLAHQLPEHGVHVGMANVTYSRPSLAGTTQVDAQFNQVNDARTGALLDASYRYASTPGQGGAFEFQSLSDLVTGAALETGNIKSRWQESGAGRADVQVTGGDVSSPVTINECWDSSFASRYLHTSFSPALNYGAESVCAFATAEYSSL